MDELNLDLIQWQHDVFRSQKRFKVVVAGRRCGKTRLSAVELITKGMQCPDKLARVMYIAPTQAMAIDLMWDLMLELARPLIAKININDGNIFLINGVTVQIRGADKPDRLRGKKLYFCVLDEMKDMKDSVWEDNVRPSLSDMEGGALFIGTPEPGDSLFRDYYEYGLSGKPEFQDWGSWHFTTYDNPFIKKSEIDAAKASMSTFAFKKEYLASFDTMGSEVFKEEWIKYGPEPEGDYYIAVDLAGFEQVNDPNKKKYLDDTAIAVVKVTSDGKWWVKKIEAGRWDVRETATRILLAIRTFKPIVVGIEKGALLKALLPYLEDLMRKNNLFKHIEHIDTAGSSKKGLTLNNRVIYALQGLFEHGRITLNPDEKWDKFKDQLLMFPSTKAHDDTCFPASAPIITREGVKPIVEVTTEDYVLTRKGYRRVLKAWCRGYDDIVTKFGITATKSHRIYTENRGWVTLDSLCIDDIIVEAQPIKEESCVKRLNSMEESITDILEPSKVTIGITIPVTTNGSQPRDCCTEMYGNSITGQSRMDTKSTTEMETSTITTLETSTVYPHQHIGWSISKVTVKEREHRNTKRISQKSGHSQKHGTLRQKEENGIDNMRSIQSGNSGLSSHALSVEQCTSQKSIDQECAAKSAREQDETTNSGISGEKRIPVYDLMVEGESEFFAYGVLVHNCDALSLISYLFKTTYFNGDASEEYEVLDEVCGF